MFTKEEIALAKPVYEAIPKIAEKAGKKWEWKPIDTEWVLFRGQARILMDIPRSAHRDECVPLLHWERIEEILEGMGYVFQEPIRRCYGSEGFKCHCVVSLNGKRVGWGWGKTRTEAVYAAVIELGKEK